MGSIHTLNRTMYAYQLCDVENFLLESMSVFMNLMAIVDKTKHTLHITLPVYATKLEEFFFFKLSIQVQVYLLSTVMLIVTWTWKK